MGPIYVGPLGYPFPTQSARRFQESFCRYASESRGWRDADLETISIRQVPTKSSRKTESGRDLYELRFSVYVESPSHTCLVDQIKEVVYILDKRWWSKKNEFTKRDVTNGIEFVATVWGDTQVKVRISLTWPDTPLLREGRMNRRETTYFKGMEKEERLEQPVADAVGEIDRQVAVQ